MSWGLLFIKKKTNFCNLTPLDQDNRSFYEIKLIIIGTNLCQGRKNNVVIQFV